MKMNIGVPCILLVLFASGCPPSEETKEKDILKKSSTHRTEPLVTKATAVLYQTKGNDVTGSVTFTKKGGEGIQITADVKGLTAGKHGFHIHEYGDCSADDATSAGGHFNPEDKPHAGPEAEQRHVGDLGNLKADETGNAHYERTDNVIAFDGPHSIVGLAVVVHSGEDDLKSQPTGNAGSRVACGVIGIAERKENK